MSEHHHDLAQEFPEFQDKIHYLKLSDRHFATLAGRYEELSKKVYRAEERIDLISEEEEEQLRRERVKLKDELYELIKKPHG